MKISPELIGLLFVVIALVVTLLDQISKSVIHRTIPEGQSFEVFSFFHLTHVKNPGAAFGIFTDQQTMLLAIGLVVVLFILFYYRSVRPKDKLVVFALGLELGGAVGNMIDRILRDGVTDFLDFRVWPVFNLADAAIVSGVVLLVIALFRAWADGLERSF